jgi:DNA-directed RNA polymerase specialized sigma24 family protein
MAVLEEEVITQTYSAREKTFAALYEQTFPPVARFVSKMGGSFADAKDIFQDALIIFYEKQLTGLLSIQGTQEAYILGIAKHLWLRKFKKAQEEISFDDLEAAISIPADYYQESTENNRLLALLQVSGSKCLELLRAFYYDQLGLPDIALIFGYHNVRSATAQKYKCLEKVRDKVKEKSISYDDLVE